MEKIFKGTQGKWRQANRVTSMIICDKEDGSTPYVAEALSRVEEEREANAKLIAAAPDLLKELVHLVRLLEPLEKEGGMDIPGLATLNGARKSIEKAL